jgi:phosphatidylglycerophosphatase A
MNLRSNWFVFLATGFFAGRIPVAPGTFGTIIGLIPCFFLSLSDILPALIYTGLFIVTAIWIAHHAEKRLNKSDPGCIVIDEMAGIMVTLLGHSFDFITVVSGVAIFRCLDILKPFPVGYVEKKLTGGMAVVCDDVVAGILSNMLLSVVLWVIGETFV